MEFGLRDRKIIKRSVIDYERKRGTRKIPRSFLPQFSECCHYLLWRGGQKTMETRSLSQSLIVDAKWAFKCSFWVGLQALMLKIQDQKFNYEFESWEDSVATVREKTNKCVMKKWVGMLQNSKYVRKCRRFYKVSGWPGRYNATAVQVCQILSLWAQVSLICWFWWFSDINQLPLLTPLNRDVE